MLNFTFSILISILFFNQFTFAQKIEPGKYVSVISYDHITDKTVYNSEYVEEINILDGINFRYRFRDDIENDIGFGKYTQGKKFLKLEFTDKPIDFDTTSFMITDSSLSANDSLKIYLQTTKNGKPFKGAYISYWKGNDKIITNKSNKNGIVTINISKKDIDGLLLISSIGYDPLRFIINTEYNKNIKINMKEPFTIIPKGKTLDYIIKDVDDDGFYAIGGIFSEWTFFKKVD